MEKLTEIRIILNSEEIDAIKEAYDILNGILDLSEDKKHELGMDNVEEAVEALHRIIHYDNFEWATYK